MFALPPAEPVFSLAKERGYLGPGPSLAGTCALINGFRKSYLASFSEYSLATWLKVLRAFETASAPDLERRSLFGNLVADSDQLFLPTRSQPARFSQRRVIRLLPVGFIVTTTAVTASSIGLFILFTFALLPGLQVCGSVCPSISPMLFDAIEFCTYFEPSASAEK